MRNIKKLVLGLAGAGMAAMLGGCGILRGAGSAATDLKPDDDTYYTMWIHSGPGSSYYTEYEDNPAMKYAESMTWGEENKTIFIDFVIPPANKEPDVLQNMYLNGNLTHILDGVIADSADIMYSNNRIIDLTEYVDKYMPNYKKVLETVEDVRKSAVYNIDGEEKILSIVGVNESYGDTNFGYEYHRDWIAKYGRHLETGEAFTGGFTNENDPDSWEDNVVFPSGGSDPIFYTITSVGLGFIIAAMGGYAISRQTRLKTPMILFLTSTLLFSGGMVPTYMVINALGWVETPLALIIPGCTNGMFSVMMMNAFNSVPHEMYEAARIDGAGHFTTMWKVMLPQAMNLGSVIILNSVIAAWNAWLPASIYVPRSRHLWPLQLVINQLINENKDFQDSANPDYSKYLIQFAAIIVAAAPLFILFPFFQDKLEKGVIGGGVKG